MLICLLYRLLCCLVGVLARGGGERELELVVLGHQLAILRRGGKRPQYTTADRALLAAASRLLPRERWSCFAVSAQTLRRWHRALLQGGRRARRRRPGRPPLAPETRRLIKRLARENPGWGYMRIEGELLKLGISVSATTVATVLRRSGLGPAPRRIGPTWSQFLRAQAQSMLGGDLSSALAESSAAGDDGLRGSAAEPSQPARDGSGGQGEADGSLSPDDAAESRHAYQPKSAQSRSALPLALPATRAPLRLQPSHRSHARDGPPGAGPRSSHRRMLSGQGKGHRRSRPAYAHQPRGPTPRLTPTPLSPAASAQPIDHNAGRHPEPSFFTPQGVRKP